MLNSLAGVLLVLLIIIAIAISIAYIIANCFIFIKMGRQWWEAIIPFYNLYVYHEKVFGNGWWFLLAFISVIPIIGWIAAILYFIVWNLRLAYSFNQSTGFAIGMMFFTPIFVMILAYGSASYRELEAFDIGHPFTYSYKAN